MSKKLILLGNAQIAFGMNNNNINNNNRVISPDELTRRNQRFEWLRNQAQQMQNNVQPIPIQNNDNNDNQVIEHNRPYSKKEILELKKKQMEERKSENKTPPFLKKKRKTIDL